ncbi:peptidylprolyl isomerase [Sphingomonas sp. GlSt437]|uniref:peptidylprolyl isomerase n=1 Tax=Sphingomonas sp. GlSt437 TaxID=3389970 RepID=UPI003A85E8C6
MKRVVAVALAGLALIAAAPPAKHVAPTAPPAPIGDTVRVVVTTDLGAITLELDHVHAPITVENFVHYVDQKRFDGTVFYRAMHLNWGDQPNGLIQGGIQNNPQRALKPIAHEPTTQTGLSHKAGAISMARNAPGSATGDFSIMLSDLTGLDADPKASGDNAGYAVFGHVVSGMDVVRKIWDQPLSPTAGEGFLKGQMIEHPVKILSARRVPLPLAAPAPATSPAPPVTPN